MDSSKAPGGGAISPSPKSSLKSKDRQISFSNYDLLLTQVLQLKITPDNQVPFVSAVLAVLRRAVIGSLGPVDMKEAKERLKELEDFERDTESDREESVLKRLRSIEEHHNR